MRRIAGALLALFLVAGCSSPSAPDDELSRADEGTQEAAKDDAAQRDADRPTGKRRKTGKNDAKAAKGAPEAEEDASDTDVGPDTDDGGSTAARPDGHGASTRPGTPSPQSGRYVYAQSGWEEFCAGTCRRSDLPASAAIDTGVSAAGTDRLKVVSESRSSKNRSMRSTSFLTEAALDIAEVELRYGSFSNTYEPSPPVRSLRLPLAVGDAWTSSWSADTSGSLHAEVVRTDRLVVGKRSIKTYKLETVTTFRGEFRGTLTSTAWIDPATAMTLRTQGKARITTDYGRLNSNFDTMLIDGPGYE